MNNAVNTSGTGAQVDDPAPALAQLTVIVVSLAGGEALASCLAALSRQNAHVVVVNTGKGGGSAPAGPSVPQLRRQALLEANTPFVGLIEDTATPGPDWCEAACRALADPRVAAAGGAVRISPALSARHQAFGLCDYGTFMELPIKRLCTDVATGDIGRLPGLAFAVRRDAVAPLLDSETGLIEGELFQALQARGWSIRYERDMHCDFGHPYLAGAKLSVRYHHGRLYGGRRLAGMPFWRRIFYAAAACLLPGLLTMRTLSLPSPDLPPSLARGFWVASLQVAWAWGEVVGYATGRVGRGLETWR